MPVSARKKSPASPTKSSKTKARPVAPVQNLDQPSLYVNRELSWLDFNQRVLEEALDDTNPLLERLKFLSIVSSNLDEFFEIRVAGLQRQIETGSQKTETDGLGPAESLAEIQRRVTRMVQEQYRCYNREIVPGLAEQGVDLMTVEDLDEKGQQWAAQYFRDQVFPVLTPLAIDPSHPFPQLLNKSLNLAVLLDAPGGGPSQGALFENWNPSQAGRLGVVQVPRVLPRLVELPAEITGPGPADYVFLSSLISTHIDQLFPGLRVLGCYAFRVTRNSELYIDEDEADNLLEAMHEHLQKRRRGDAVRLEVQRGCDPQVRAMLLRTFELEPIDLYEVDGPINLTRLMTVYSAVRKPELKDPSFVPVVPRALRQIDEANDLFAAIRRADILLHHPYESFQPVVDFIAGAADDPQVLAIKQTLYRTSGDSPIVRALMRAAQNGKQVTALVELKARFDEENNIQWARAMEEAGVHVLYGMVGLKTHCKMSLVVRREEGKTIRRYVHLGTGNYNEVTARLYTDVGLLTARPEIGEDVAKIFNLMTGMGQYTGLLQLHMAPFRLHQTFLDLIERETAQALRAAKSRSTKRGATPHIIVKMNALVDPQIIRALYRASQAGVKVDLIVRGICCLRPGLPGVSENISVRSIVDRYLEHSRIFYFNNDGNEEIYCGSADWMPRNFFRRIETLFPILDPDLKKRLRDEILGSCLRDNTKARLMRSDGCYARARRRSNEKPFRAQEWLMQKANEEKPGDDTKFLPARAGALPPANLSQSIDLKIRPHPNNSAPPSADGRAGTGTDPVLQSVKQSLENAVEDKAQDT
ncbi:MAG TPA: polyphosphate kinase 1 [Abditibacteriaceae bacterium]